MKHKFLLSFLTIAFVLNGANHLFSQKNKIGETAYSIDAKTAYARWLAAPDKITILDVRTTGEYVFVGHAPMAHNIPLLFLGSDWNSEKSKYTMPMNENFLTEVEAKFSKSDTFFVMCRSGSRSAKSAKILNKAGFKYVYNINDGFEGTTLKAENSYKNGQRIINGWKNCGAPWTNSLDPKLVYRQKE